MLRAAILCLLLAACADEPLRPCVLVVSIDTCRADHCGWLGARLPDGTSPTPHLDRLAARASGPREALSCVPLTLPAHTTLFSGLLPDATGVRENDSFRVPAARERGYTLLAEELRDAGYETAAFVSGQPLEAACGLNAGFRSYSAPDKGLAPEGELRFRERDCQETSRLARAWMQQQERRPWFLFVHYFDPHQPWERRPEGASLPAGPHSDYQSEIMAVDSALGTLLADLPADTLIVVLADHGEGLGEHGEETHGHLVHDATLRVPFLMVLPAGLHSARAAEPPARLEDVAPTLRAALALPAQNSDGASLLQACDVARWRSSAESLYPWYQFRCARERAFRDAEWKLTESGAAQSLHAWERDSAELHDEIGAQDAVAQRLRRELEQHALRPRSGRAQPQEVEPSAHAPYMGGRSMEQKEFPSDEENRGLPAVSSVFPQLRVLDRVRALIREGHPAEGALLLEPLAPQAASNPAILFWMGRCADLAARATQLEPASRTAFAQAALRHYDRHAELFADPRSADAALRVLLEIHSISGNAESLRELERRATGMLNVRKPRGLTLALRGRARERLGERQLALDDYRAAQQLQPQDQRLAQDVERLAAALRPR